MLSARPAICQVTVRQSLGTITQPLTNAVDVLDELTTFVKRMQDTVVKSRP
jgi:hypothetical protein